jgi:hypothetical protein
MRRADHLSRGVLPSVVCLSVIVKRRTMTRPRPLRGCRAIIKKYIVIKMHKLHFLMAILYIQIFYTSRVSVSSLKMAKNISFFFLWLNNPFSGALASSFRGFTITLRHTTLGRTPLDE